ncbi:hypothetical protein XH87_07855 [Bradyrhizobium sp. CCBAU 53415]|nr:hypothetical protein [Bradyrhizobium sp. CCBAU 53415]
MIGPSFQNYEARTLFPCAFLELFYDLHNRLHNERKFGPWNFDERFGVSDTLPVMPTSVTWGSASSTELLMKCRSKVQVSIVQMIELDPNSAGLYSPTGEVLSMRLIESGLYWLDELRGSAKGKPAISMPFVKVFGRMLLRAEFVNEYRSMKKVARSNSLQIDDIVVLRRLAKQHKLVGALAGSIFNLGNWSAYYDTASRMHHRSLQLAAR